LPGGHAAVLPPHGWKPLTDPSPEAVNENEPGRPPERPDYKVYRSRPGLLSRLRAPDLSKLRERTKRKGPGRAPRGKKTEKAPRAERPLWRRVLKWTGIAALAWILISFLAFEISSQIQKSKLIDMGNTLHGNPFLAVSPQTILVIGTDIRSGQFAGANEAASKSCLDAAGSGKPPPSHCTPYRSDTLMLIRAGGGDFRKLSIPRDTLANIPGQPENKINSAYATGGAKLTVRTIEKFLGINVDQVAIIDFDGFRKFIDSIGGVDVNVPTDVCSNVSGAFILQLNKGEHTLNGYQAITLARTRENNLNLPGELPSGVHLRKFCQNPPAITDINRVQFQQAILDGIRGRLTDPLRLPYNFIKGPFIGWNAPKAIVSSMGAWTMPQLVFGAIIGFNKDSDVLKPSSTTAAGNLIIPRSECERAVKKFLGGNPPHTPACSPPS
jgi:LCP family protein required for cell wall assembly